MIWRASPVIIAYRGEGFVSEEKPVPVLSPQQAEVDRILERFGHRYEGWKGSLPAPVDGDLLGGLATLYCKPLRLLPCGCKGRLSNHELTILRRAANRLPPHFVLGIIPCSHACLRRSDVLPHMLLCCKPAETI